MLTTQNMTMRKIIFSIIAVIALTGCSSKGTEPGPEEAVEIFYTALFAGDFDKAEDCCGSVTMQDYINSFRSAWADNDDTTAAILPAILAETGISISAIEKSGQIRTIFYTLTAVDGKKKEKIATLGKDEGKWKITAITDRH